MPLVMVLVLVFVVLFGGGFAWGWFVRGWEVKKLRVGYKQLMDHALRAGWVVSGAELLKNLREHGVGVPYIPAQFSEVLFPEEGKEPSQADVICGLLEQMRSGTEEQAKTNHNPVCPQCQEGTISKLTGACSKCDHKEVVLPFPNYGKDKR